jgi:hypothetical protein
MFAGLTSQTIDIFIPDSASTVGAGKTGLVHNTASLSAYYRKGATGTATEITLATQTVGGAWASGGFVEVDATNMPGVYRFDIPNALIDTAGITHIQLKGAAGMAPVMVRLDCRALPASVKDVITDSLSAAGISAAAAAKIADVILRRSQASVEGSSNGDSLSLGSLYGLIQQAQESDGNTTPGTLTVFRTDGTTSLGTKTLNTNASAVPVDKIS